MKKILGLTVAALLVIGLVGGGTWAYFSDTETSTGNILTAGTLDLNVDGGDIAVTTLNVPATYPGDTGSGSTTLLNSGSITGELDISTGSVTNTGAEAGTSEYADDSGDLGGVATIAIFIDVDESTSWTAGDIGLKSDATTYSHPTALDYATIDSYASKSWGGSAGVEAMATAASDGFIIMYDVPTAAVNNIQGDSASIDFTFTLEQAAAD